MSEPVLETIDLQKSFGGIAATSNVSIRVAEHGVHAVIGPNGAGKTTLLSQLSGSLMPDAGEVRFCGKEITHLPEHQRALLGIARSFQITSIFHDMSVLENVALAVQAHAGHSYRFWSDARQAQELSGPAMAALDQVGLGARANDSADAMSHGEHRQLEIAMALASRPKLLLLDEPMAGMGLEESKQMVDILLGLKGQHTMLLIEHDMDVVFALADQITVLVYGKVIATGSPDEIRNDPEVRRAYLGDEGQSDA
ncbi:MAG: ABC transporter ATP-binding protein [Sedimenticola sp.]